MSTVFRVAGQGKKLTREKIFELVKKHKGRVNEDPSVQAGLIIVELVSGYVHVYRTGRVAWNSFERFGDNHSAAHDWRAILAKAGIPTLSEYDEGF